MADPDASWPKTLYKMLQEADPNIVCWSADGTTFYIRSKIEFEKPGGVLQKYFPGCTTGYAAFSRTCCNYFMLAIPSRYCPLPTLGHRHQFGIFHRDHPERLKYVYTKNQLKNIKNREMHEACLYSFEEDLDDDKTEPNPEPVIITHKPKLRPPKPIIKKNINIKYVGKKPNYVYQKPSSRSRFVALIAMLSRYHYIDDESIRSLKVTMNDWLKMQPEYTTVNTETNINIEK
jgi:hypothetical protein